MSENTIDYIEEKNSRKDYVEEKVSKKAFTNLITSSLFCLITITILRILEYTFGITNNAYTTFVYAFFVMNTLFCIFALIFSYIGENYTAKVIFQVIWDIVLGLSVILLVLLLFSLRSVFFLLFMYFVTAFLYEVYIYNLCDYPDINCDYFSSYGIAYTKRAYTPLVVLIVALPLYFIDLPATICIAITLVIDIILIARFIRFTKYRRLSGVFKKRFWHYRKNFRYYEDSKSYAELKSVYISKVRKEYMDARLKETENKLKSKK